MLVYSAMVQFLLLCLCYGLVLYLCALFIATKEKPRPSGDNPLVKNPYAQMYNPSKSHKWEIRNLKT